VFGISVNLVDEIPVTMLEGNAGEILAVSV
jgi:hypothetical protein